MKGFKRGSKGVGGHPSFTRGGWGASNNVQSILRIFFRVLAPNHRGKLFGSCQMRAEGPDPGNRPHEINGRRLAASCGKWCPNMCEWCILIKER